MRASLSSNREKSYNPIQGANAGDILRDGDTKQQIQVPSLGNDKHAFEYWLDEQGHKNVEVLVVTDPDKSKIVSGDQLAAVRIDYNNLSPEVNFDLTAEGGALFADLTTENAPTQTNSRRLGILMDDSVLSAPNINEPITGGSVRISGNFTKEEVSSLVNVLESGRLPATLNPQPLSEEIIEPTLGADMMKKGSIAIMISLIAVLIFMAIFYRFSGLVACSALLANLLLIVGVMTLISADFTLPGLAGLVLTVGMSVDANVLIFERIREETNKGTSMRMAIRNGFQRATTTIVDANLTTLITAIILYSIGTDQIKGFAVTLILGILMSMYTAIFCSRLVFEIAERKRWFSKLSMMSIVGKTNIDFLSRRKIAAVVSVVLIAVGIGGSCCQRYRPVGY